MEKRPETFGGYVDAGWTMEVVCVACDGISRRKIDMAAEVAKLDATYPTKQWMLDAQCPRCGKKPSMYTFSLEDQKPMRFGNNWMSGKK